MTQSIVLAQNISKAADNTGTFTEDMSKCYGHWQVKLFFIWPKLKCWNKLRIQHFNSASKCSAGSLNWDLKDTARQWKGKVHFILISVDSGCCKGKRLVPACRIDITNFKTTGNLEYVGIPVIVLHFSSSFSKAKLISNVNLINNVPQPMVFLPEVITFPLWSCNLLPECFVVMPLFIPSRWYRLSGHWWQFQEDIHLLVSGVWEIGPGQGTIWHL